MVFSIWNLISRVRNRVVLQVDEIIEQIKRKSSQKMDGLEVINSWELMEGLELDEVENQQMSLSRAAVGAEVRKSPKVSNFVRGIDSISPMRFFSPRKGKRFGSGKENKAEIGSIGPRRAESSPNGGPLISVNKLKKASPNLKLLTERNWIDPKSDRSSRRRSLSPLFDPELLDFLENDLTDKENEFKKAVNSLAPNWNSNKNNNDVSLKPFIKKCPPGGEDSVIIYATTLRGIRNTFEDCNIVRSIMESYEVHIIERDISMDSGLKEELRKLMGTKEVKVPMLFVKGKMISGAEIVGENGRGRQLESFVRRHCESDGWFWWSRVPRLR